MGNKNTGTYDKFYVRRNDGQSGRGKKHYKCKYWTLDLTHDPHAIPALAAYSKSVRADGYIMLADDLDEIIQVVQATSSDKLPDTQ